MESLPEEEEDGMQMEVVVAQWWPLVALFLAALASSVASALTAFGLAIIFHVVLQLLLLLGLLTVELPHVVVYIVLMGPFALWPLFVLYRREVDWRLFGLIFPPKVVLLFVGTHLLVSYDSAMLKKVLGILLLIFAVWKLYVEFKEPILSFVTRLRNRSSSKPPSAAGPAGAEADSTSAEAAASSSKRPKNIAGVLDDYESSSLALCEDDGDGDGEEDEEKATRKPLLVGRRSSSDVSLPVTTLDDDGVQKPVPFSYPFIALIVACGAASGLMGGMFGVSGPPLMIIVTFAPMEKGPLRSTFLGIFALTNLPQTYALYRQGLFSWDDAPEYLAVATGSLLGTLLGNMLYKYMSTQMLMRGIIFLLICSCLTLLDLPNWVLIAFCVATVLGAIGYMIISTLNRHSTKVSPSDIRQSDTAVIEIPRKRETYLTCPDKT